MSSDAIHAVWKHSQSKGNARLLLLAIADHAHDDGTGTDLSNALLMSKTRSAERTVRANRQVLEELKELETLLNEGEGGVNRYRILLPGLGGAAESAGSIPAGGRQESRGADIAAGGPETAGGRQQQVPELAAGGSIDAPESAALKPSSKDQTLKTVSDGTPKASAHDVLTEILPSGTQLPESFKNQLAGQVKRLLKTENPEVVIEAGKRLINQRRVPTALAWCVEEVKSGKPANPNGRNGHVPYENPDEDEYEAAARVFQ